MPIAFSPCPGVQCNIDSPTTGFIAEFQAWVLTDFARADRSVEAYDLDCDALTSLLRLRVDLACQVIAPRLRELEPEDARVLRGLFNHTLDRIEQHCNRCEQRFADALLDLSPLDDVLIALALAEDGLLATSNPTPSLEVTASL